MSDTLTVHPDVLNELAEYHDEADLHADYSGRAMYGRNCLGYTGENLAMFTFHLALSIHRHDDETGADPDLFQVEELLNLIGDPRSDSLGRSTIYYWPHITVSDAE